MTKVGRPSGFLSEISNDHFRIVVFLVSHLNKVRQSYKKTFDFELVEVGFLSFLIRQVASAEHRHPKFEIHGENWILSFYGGFGFHPHETISPRTEANILWMRDPKDTTIHDLCLEGDHDEFESNMLYIKFLDVLP
jgi:hypothetical protein